MSKRHWNRVGDLESMFLRLEELVLANSGEDEFEEVFKLLVAKLWDERDDSRRFRAHSDPKDTVSAIVDLLREAERAWPGIVDPGTVPLLTPEHLQVCVEALAQHEVSGSALEVFDGFFEFLVGKAAKGSKGQYFTPRHVVEMCVRMTRPRPGETVLDPACGSGGFLVHALEFRRRDGNGGTGLADYCRDCLWGFDIDGRAVRVAKALMVLAGDGAANVLRVNSLMKPECAGLFPTAPTGADTPPITIEDVMRTRRRKHRGFDVILTNPPFAGEVRERSLLDAYDLGTRRDRVERDVLFVERCVELLRPGGRMAMVLPHNKFVGDAFTDLRTWLMVHCRVVAVVGLGRHTFLPHTHQKAAILFVEKRATPHEGEPREQTFFAVSERDGKDSKGKLVNRPSSEATAALWDRVDHDFADICCAFDEFRTTAGVWKEE